MPVILGANSASGGYNITNSLRFNSGSSDNLTRTFGTATSRRIYTISTWVKRSNLGTVQNIFTGGTGSGDAGIKFRSTDDLQFSEISSPYSAYNYEFNTSQLFRDVSAWYHILVAFDSTQATNTNRVKIYVNGSQITAFATASYPSQNYDGFINNNITHRISGAVDTTFGTRYFGGYVSETYFIDGQQLTPSSFGETDEDTGIWKPKAYTGSFGTNGFYLDFEDSANLGNDMSGNNNDFTVNNLTSIDQTTDTPTNNFATLNSLIKDSGSYLSQGNLRGYQASASHASLIGTLGVSAGKWYFEGKLNTIGSVANASAIGVCGLQCAVFKDTAYNAGDSVNDMVYVGGGDKQFNSTSSAYGNSFTTGDIIGVALDMDNNKLYFSKNGTFQNSGVPTSGATGTGAISLNSGDTYFPLIGLYGGTIWEMNFGNPFVSGNSYTDGAGYGNFSYAVPSGYYALCTKNLAEFG